MTKVKFGDVIREVKTNIDRSNNPYKFFIAGEHMESEKLEISSKGEFSKADVGPAFTRLFLPGQVLYGTRRTYLKKVSVPDFAGITSNTTFVLETKDEALFKQSLLPFLLLSDDFTDFSVKNSKGSTNPYILFSDIAKYEFYLPSPDKQEEIASILLSGNETRVAYRRLLSALEELVKLRFVEIFGDMKTNPFGWEQSTIGECCTLKSGTTLPIEVENEGGPIPYVKVGDMNYPGNERYIVTSSRYVSEATAEKKLFEVGSVLFPKRGGAISTNKKRMTKLPVCADLNVMGVSSNGKLLPEYLLAYFDMIDLGALADGSSVPQINNKNIAPLVISIPPMEEQEKFSTFIEQSDKLKFVVQDSMEKLNDWIRAFTNQVFS